MRLCDVPPVQVGSLVEILGEHETRYVGRTRRLTATAIELDLIMTRGGTHPAPFCRCGQRLADIWVRWDGQRHHYTQETHPENCGWKGVDVRDWHCPLTNIAGFWLLGDNPPSVGFWLEKDETLLDRLAESAVA